MGLKLTKYIELMVQLHTAGMLSSEVFLWTNSSYGLVNTVQ